MFCILNVVLLSKLKRQAKRIYINLSKMNNNYYIIYYK